MSEIPNSSVEAAVNESVVNKFLVGSLLPAYQKTKDDTEILFGDLIDSLFDKFLEKNETLSSFDKNCVQLGIERRVDASKNGKVTKEAKQFSLDDTDYIRIQTNVKEWINEHNVAENIDGSQKIENQQIAKHLLQERQTRLEKRLTKQGKTVESYLQSIVKKA